MTTFAGITVVNTNAIFNFKNIFLFLGGRGREMANS